MAFLTDFHCHTNISLDGLDSMADMARAERAAGMDIVCFTDHCDTVDWVTSEFYPPCRTVAERVCKAYDKCRDSLPAGLDLRIGIELGETIFYPELGPELYAAPGLDFVLGSLHITRETGDFCDVVYTDEAQCRALTAHYLEKLLSVAQMGCYDVLAHIGYLRRYMWQSGFDQGPNLRENREVLEAILRCVIEKGKGIEINCSGIRDGCGAFPSEEILRLYKDLGGEIITVGSDAHCVADAAKCIPEGFALLRQVGFRYVTAFKQHQAEFYPI